MSLESVLNFEDYNQYPGEEGSTTEAQIQDYFKNQNSLLAALVNSFLWQPGTEYALNKIVYSPSMPAGLAAVCMQAGTTSATTEPTWLGAGEVVSDGSVIWLMFYNKTSVNGITANEYGDIVIDKDTIGLDLVDNTPDSEKVVAQAGKVGSVTVGGTSQPVYINGGTPTALSGNVGSASQPMYMAAGVLKALSNTIGSASKPVYIDAGVIKACSTALGASANGGIIAQSLGTNGYVKFANGLILQWGIANLGTAKSLALAFGNTNYTLIHSKHNINSVANAAQNYSAFATYVSAKATTYVTFAQYDSSSGTVAYYACGT